jgi:ubiquinone biosynthesis protein
MAVTNAAARPHRVHELSSMGRARQIAAVLARHHLWRLIELLALEHLVPFGHHNGTAQPSVLITPIQLRLTLEELGPTFMKLGQVLSTRADLLTPDFQSELSSLQDQAPPIPIEAILEIIEAELGQPASERFASFDTEPLATGSIGQAHLATLHDGTEVVVKVRRPGAVEQIDEDLKLLHRLAVIANGRLEKAQEFDLVGIVKAFDSSLRAEVDYQHEGHNAEKFGRNFKGSERVHVPRIYWETTTSRVLTMERIRGIRITDVAALKAAGIDCDVVADGTTKVVLKMLLDDGFFHADLHPGNLFIESETRIGLIDFGMVGILDEETKAGLGRMLYALVQRDSDALVDSLLSLGVAGGQLDRPALQRDLDDLISRYYDQALGEMKLGAFLNDVFSVVRAHRLVMPPELSMLAKTVITAEGMVAQLDPGFQMMESTQPYVTRLIMSRNSPQAWAQRFGRAAPDILWLAAETPKIARGLVGSIQKGQFSLAVEPRGLEPYLHRVEKTANRLVLAMLMSALVIAAAFIVSVYHPVLPGGVIGPILAGLVGAVAVAGVALVWISRRKSLADKQPGVH